MSWDYVNAERTEVEMKYPDLNWRSHLCRLQVTSNNVVRDKTAPFYDLRSVLIKNGFQPSLVVNTNKKISMNNHTYQF